VIVMSAEIQELAVRYGTAWAERDVDAIVAMHTDDTVFHLHGGGEPAIGRAATQEAIATVLAQWPDIRFERKRVYIGNGHFVSEYQMSVTNAEGRLLVCDGVDVFAVSDGRVARKDTYLDWPALQEQQGAAPVSAISA
jgi:ketosteroid isomerase-like protein